MVFVSIVGGSAIAEGDARILLTLGHQSWI